MSTGWLRVWLLLSCSGSLQWRLSAHTLTTVWFSSTFADRTLLCLWLLLRKELLKASLQITRMWWECTKITKSCWSLSSNVSILRKNRQALLWAVQTSTWRQIEPANSYQDLISWSRRQSLCFRVNTSDGTQSSWYAIKHRVICLIKSWDWSQIGSNANPRPPWTAKSKLSLPKEPIGTASASTMRSWVCMTATLRASIKSVNTQALLMEAS